MPRKVKHIDRADLRDNIRTIIIGQCFGGPLPQVLMNGGVFSLLILQLGGSKFEIGLVFMLNFVAQTIRVFTARFADVRDTRRMYLIWTHISNFVFLLIFLVEPVRRTLGPQLAIYFACLVFLLQRVTINVGGTAYQPLLAQIVPQELRGRFTGAMRRAFQIVSLGVTILAGIFIGNDPGIGRFYVVLAVLVASSFVRPILFARLPRPRRVAGKLPEPIRKNISRPFRDMHFRRFLLFWAFLVFAINIARPFTVPFMKQDLGFPSSITVYASSLLVLGMAISVLEWGKVADKLGNRVVFLFNICLLSVSFLMVACIPTFSRSQVLAVAIGAISVFFVGISIGGLGIAHTVRTLNAAPRQYRGSYMSAFFIVNGLVAGGTSTLSGFIIDSLPANVEIFSATLPLLRLYFPLAAVLIVASIPLLRRLKRISEPPMREAVSVFSESLPSVISLPLQAIRVPYRKVK